MSARDLYLVQSRVAIKTGRDTESDIISQLWTT